MTKTLMAFLIGLTLPTTVIADTLKLSRDDAPSNNIGGEVSPNIIGGEAANPSDWKFIASLIQKGQPTSRGPFCGGSFLGGKYVLTAAHCVEGVNAGDLDIVLGLYNINDESQTQRVAVNNIYVHDAYDNFTLNNDIALIELTHNVDSTAIELATPDVLNSVRAGDKLHIAGWGNTSTTSNVFPTVLQQVDVEYVDRTTCQALGGDYNDVSDDGICAGYVQGGKDSCQGDSGGPLVFDFNGIKKLLGTVSWGNGCAQPNAYGVYANVAYFQDSGWIDSHRNTVSFTQFRDLHVLERTTQQETFVVRNNDTISFDITDSQVSAGLAIRNNTCNTTLLPSQSCQVTVSFTPDYFETSETIELSTNHPKLPTLTTTLKYRGADRVNRPLRNVTSRTNATTSH
ncbi:serine protease [Vibrio sp. AND4]|uniref:serine protease n=1 Tax=Vibrio sp. AND4 TaxID=314289 RepID=UPI00015F0582|nr:serine protease [Vibrio sp. AND4]EDP58423.1 formyltetrahydrofolate deformylase [Vibrio sp. AND4]